MRVYVLDTGYLICDKDVFVIDEGQVYVGKKEEDIVKTKAPVMAILIDHPDGKILYDTGSNENAMNGYWPDCISNSFPSYSNNLVKQLELCNTTPEEIKTLVISHFHFDHAGNIALFKNAEVYLSKIDYEYGLNLVNRYNDPSMHGAYVKADFQVSTEKFHFVDDDFQLKKGIDIINLPGHAPGLLGLVIKLEKDGTIIFPQDCLYTSGNYGPPAKRSAIVYSQELFYKSIEKVRKLQQKYNAKVMFAHDLEFFNTIKKAPEYYE